MQLIFIKYTKMLVTAMKWLILLNSNNGVTIISTSNIAAREEVLAEYFLMILTMLIGRTVSPS